MTYSMMQEDWINYKQIQQEKARSGSFYVSEDGGANEWLAYLFDDRPMEDD